MVLYRWFFFPRTNFHLDNLRFHLQRPEFFRDPLMSGLGMEVQPSSVQATFVRAASSRAKPTVRLSFDARLVDKSNKTPFGPGYFTVEYYISGLVAIYRKDGDITAEEASEAFLQTCRAFPYARDAIIHGLLAPGCHKLELAEGSSPPKEVLVRCVNSFVENAAERFRDPVTVFEIQRPRRDIDPRWPEPPWPPVWYERPVLTDIDRQLRNTELTTPPSTLAELWVVRLDEERPKRHHPSERFLVIFEVPQYFEQALVAVRTMASTFDWADDSEIQAVDANLQFMTTWAKMRLTRKEVADEAERHSEQTRLALLIVVLTLEIVLLTLVQIIRTIYPAFPSSLQSVFLVAVMAVAAAPWVWIAWLHFYPTASSDDGATWLKRFWCPIWEFAVMGALLLFATFLLRTPGDLFWVAVTVAIVIAAVPFIWGQFHIRDLINQKEELEARARPAWARRAAQRHDEGVR